MAPKKVRFVLIVDEDTRDVFTARANEENMTQSGFFERILADWLQRNPTKARLANWFPGKEKKTRG